MKKAGLLPKSGIYLITNVINQKKYVGKDKTLPGRWRTHKCDLKAGRHSNSHLQNAWKLYGGNAFIFEILTYCLPEDLVEQEDYWMLHFGILKQNGTFDSNKGYNKKKADGSEMSSDAIARMSTSHMGQTPWN